MKRRNRKQKIPHAARQRQPAPFKPITFPEALACFPPNVRAMICRAHRLKPPCLLCHEPCAVVCTFIPKVQHAWGIPPGWRGGCVYTLCQGCLRLQDVQARVEALLWQGRGQAAASWN